MSRAMTDFLLWIPTGALLGCFIARRFITRRVFRTATEAGNAQLPPDQWRLEKARIRGYRLGLYAMAALAGAIVGAGLGALALVFD